MKRRWFVTVVFLCGLFLASGAWAQGPQPPHPGPQGPACSRISPCQAESLGGPFLRQADGLWYMSGQASAGVSARSMLTATGGPDEYGYTWDDSVPLDWIDVSGGTDTGLNSSTNYVGPIPLGFSFRYYENTYSQLYISRHGVVAFNSTGMDNPQGEIPHPSWPNDVIAPHWVPVDDVLGYVRYTTRGEAPNRRFIVEWNQIENTFDVPDTYTFELILHQNGDMVFQYGTMNPVGGRYCEASGIEDSTGLDGLPITPMCQAVASNHAVHIHRPAPAARVRLHPRSAGTLSQPGAVESFQQRVRNTGDLGTDTFDLTASCAWTVSFYAADGVTPLADTDSDGTLDTGPLAQAAEVVVVVKVLTPGTAVLGDSNSAQITARSSVDASKSSTATLYTGIGPPIAQVYRDDADGAMSLYLVNGGPKVLKATPDGYHASSIAIAEAPNRNLVYAWTKGRSEGSRYVVEVEYTLLNHLGAVVRPVSKLTDHSGAMIDTYDSVVAVAVAPDGQIGFLWYRSRWDYSTSRSNYNIHLAIVDGTGSLAYGPVNVTNNDVWGTWSDYSVPRFWNPRIAATEDNRFVLAWYRQHAEAAGNVDDIYYAVYRTTGPEVRAVTKFTDDFAGWCDGHSYPNLTGLRGNRVLLTWTRDGPDDIYYAVLDSAGDVVKDSTNLVGDGTSYYDIASDAAQLADGRIVVAWQAGWYPETRIRYAVLDGNYDRVAGPTALENPAARLGSSYVSVAAAGNQAVLTWMDYDWSYRPNLYYALAGSAGNVVTPPMIFRSSQATSPYIFSSFEGSGNTSYSQLPNHAPTNRTLQPSRGAKAAGSRVAFTATWQDADGWYDLSRLQFHLGKTQAQRNGCRVMYDLQTNKLYLLNNAGTRWVGGVAPGSASVLRNRQCTLNCRNTTVAKSGTTVRVKWNLVFDRSFRGLKRTYLQATDVQGGSAPWQKKGTWRVR